MRRNNHYFEMAYGEGAGGGGGVFGTMALQNADNVNITGGSITGLTILETRELCFSNGTNNFNVCFTTCVPSANVDFVLPCALGAAGSVLMDLNGNGTLTFQNMGVADVTVTDGHGTYFDISTLAADGDFLVDEGLPGQTYGETIQYGDVLYLKAADSKWWKARANVVGTSGNLQLAIAIAGGNADTVHAVMLRGIIRADAKFPALTIGGEVFLSVATAGLVVTAQPAANTGEVNRLLGNGLTADMLRFNPSNDASVHT